MTSPDRLSYDDNNELDDVVINNVDMFRLERMSNNDIWIAVYRGDKRVAFSIGTRHGLQEIEAFVTENELDIIKDKS